jgi:hypothetical protein
VSVYDVVQADGQDFRPQPNADAHGANTHIAFAK